MIYLVNTKRKTKRPLVGKICPKCNEIFMAGAKRCPHDKYLLLPIWGEEEEYDGSPPIIIKPPGNFISYES